MPILNSTPYPKDVVILQRDDTNTYYGETHISGTNAIMYIDSAGYLNADKSASFYSTFPPPNYPPIGSIIAWYKGFSGVPALNDCWIECNGQSITDPDSPLSGNFTPALNT